MCAAAPLFIGSPACKDQPPLVSSPPSAGTARRPSSLLRCVACTASCACRRRRLSNLYTLYRLLDNLHSTSPRQTPRNPSPLHPNTTARLHIHRGDDCGADIVHDERVAVPLHGLGGAQRAAHPPLHQHPGESVHAVDVHQSLTKTQPTPSLMGSINSLIDSPSTHSLIDSSTRSRALTPAGLLRPKVRRRLLRAREERTRQGRTEPGPRLLLAARRHQGDGAAVLLHGAAAGGVRVRGAHDHVLLAERGQQLGPR